MFAGSTSQPFRVVFACFAVGVVVLLAGCGKGTHVEVDSISGKVTLSGQPVAGQVIFVGRDRQPFGVPIGPQGDYYLNAPPKGDFTILVKPHTTATGKAPEMPGVTAPAGVAPPAKYATAAGGLKVTITGGEQKHDITLSP